MTIAVASNDLLFTCLYNSTGISIMKLLKSVLSQEFESYECAIFKIFQDLNMHCCPFLVGKETSELWDVLMAPTLNDLERLQIELHFCTKFKSPMSLIVAWFLSWFL